MLANRLSASGQHPVLLLEAGGAPHSPWFKVPVGYRHTIGHPQHDWCYEGEPEPGLNGRRLRHPRGKVLGGSSAINGMVAIRGQAADYDAWRDMGLPGWGWSDVLPHFKRGEDHVLGGTAHHGAGGEWRVDAARVHWPVQDDVHAAAVHCGIPAVHDFNTGDNEGVGPIHVNQRNGQRWSAADAFLAPARHRANLHVRTGALVQTLQGQGRQISGVRWRDAAGGEHLSQARIEVVLAAGAIGTPQLLLRSGLGPAAQLQAHGIGVVADVPGVGENLHDHLQVALRWKLALAHPLSTLNAHMRSPWRKAMMAARYALTRRGPLTMAPCQIGMFTRSTSNESRADIGWNVLAFSKPGFTEPFDPFPGLTLIAYDLRPTSSGRLTLAAADAHAAPRICMNYLATERDQQRIVAAMRQARLLLAAPPLARHAPQEQWPGPGVADDDAALLAAARNAAGTIYHPVGSARMGPDHDPMAVCDARLRMRAVSGLRIVDASIMPSIPSGNTASPTVMVAEKGAQMLLEDANHPGAGLAGMR